jgi:hypothetical protein
MTTNTKTCHYIEAEDIWILPKGRATFVALEKKWRAKDAKPDEDGQFAVSYIVPDDFDLDPIKKVVKKLAAEKFKTAKGAAVDILSTDAKLNGGVASPFLEASEKVQGVTTNEGDEVDIDDWTMIRANSYSRRPIVRNSKGEIVDVDDLALEAYSGRWMRLMVRPKDYEHKGKKGVKFYVEGVQLLGHDDKIGSGGGTSGEAFGAVDDEDGDTGLE